jgi:hypothetical protein
MDGWMDGWMGGWVGGWVEVKAVLRIAYSNQKYLFRSFFFTNTSNSYKFISFIFSLKLHLHWLSVKSKLAFWGNLAFWGKLAGYLVKKG